MNRNNIESEELQAVSSQTPVAIIGMAAIFPQSKNLEEFWDTILKKMDCITDVPASRWKIEDYYDPDPKTPDKSYCKRGGFIPDIDFDPAEFGLPPNILEATDVSQLLALAVAKEALVDAGYGNADTAVRDNTGVILGTVVGQQSMRPLMARMQYPIWEKVLRSTGLPEEAIPPIIEKMKLAYTNWEENSFPGFLSNVIAGRIANRLDLGGINSVVDAACASSLSAVKMAVNELASFNCDMMLTGGVDIDNSILTYMCFSKTPAFSKNENIRPFDTGSDGMMAGEGVGMLVLKRLADAERDGDRIYAVIKGIGASSDGRFKSIYAPRPEGQAKALRRAYRSAGVAPETIGLLEAHGTGTVAGDLCEVTALGQVFGESVSAPDQIALGSVKSQIGHTKAAAGAASLIKTALALYHKILPPTINITEPNPKLKLDQTPFYLNTQPRPWLRREQNTPRRAGVSSFGFGGTNFHVILEEYEREPKPSYRLHQTAQMVLLEASTPEALLAHCENWLAKLQSDEAGPCYNELVEASGKLKIPATSARLGFVAGSLAEAQELLRLGVEQLRSKGQSEAWEHPRGLFYRRQSLKPDGKIVALFSGQGSQYLEMGRELALNFPSLREAYSAMDQLFQQDNLALLSSVVFPPPVFDKKRQTAQVGKLQRTNYAQPAIGVFSAWLYRLLQQAGFRPDFVAGHSFGELTALWAAGVLSEADYLKLVKARGQAMAAPEGEADFDPGTMLAVMGNLEGLPEVLKEFPEITLANLNSPAQAVLAGSKAAVAKVQAHLQQKGFNVSPLPVAAAFHTPLVGHAQKPFEKVVKSTAFQQPNIPIYSNSTAQPYPANPADMQQILSEHLLKPVLFQQQIENIYAEGGYFFIEFGPRDILTNLVKNILGDKPHFALALNASRQKDSDSQLRRAIIQLRVAGLELGEVDAYQKRLPAPAATKPGRLNVRLNGSPYVSKATQDKFEKALKEGYEVKLSMSNSFSKNGTSENVPVAPAPAKPEPLNPPAVLARPEPLQTVMPAEPVYQASLETLEAGLNQFSQYQAGVLQVHEQYLNNQGEYTRGFFQLMQQQQSLLLGGAVQPAPAIVESIERNMHRFHDYQSETLRVHDHYLQQQADYSSQLFQALGGSAPPSAAISAPTLRPVAAHMQKAALPAYTPPAPPPVSLAPSAPTPIVAAPPVAAPAIAPYKTPEVVNVSAPAAKIEPPAPVPVVPAPPLIAAVVPPTSPPVPGKTAGVSVEALSQTLLEVVSEKTGYPVEMLELTMDMEADLGIDSIKRVEILGAVQERYPNLPRLNPEELAELRTLGQITARLGAFTGQSEPKAESVAVAPVQTTLVQVDPTATAPASTSGMVLSESQLADTLLKVVSEKTGYPVEMLELNMDMEADLGIDSIKRVEILGAMQEIHSDLPRLNPEELAELRTLGQIIERMSSSAPPTTPEKVILPEIKLPVYEIASHPVRLKYLPDPDYLEFTPANQVCLLTDEGTTLTGKLAQKLGDEGWKVVVLSFPPALVPSSALLPEEVERVTLTDLSETQLEQTLKTIAEKYGPVSSFIHLNPLSQPAGLPFEETEKALVKQVFLIAGHLKKSLNEAARKGRACFMTVVRLDGELGLGGKHSYGAIAGGLFGLTKSLNLEWEGVFCRALDLAPELDTTQAVEAIRAELHDPSHLLGEVGYSPKGRFTLAEEQIVLNGERL